jgi:hypothetical protein
VRTWEQNKTTINQLWPTCSFTDEEKRLWGDDLGSLDQDVLYDAIRNVKRTRDTQWPQLKWMLDAYRELSHAKRQAKTHGKPPEPRVGVNINEDENSRLADDFVAYIESAAPSDYQDIHDRVLDKLTKMHSRTALRVIAYAKKRLLGEEPRFGRVDDNGDITPFGMGGAA